MRLSAGRRRRAERREARGYSEISANFTVVPDEDWMSQFEAADLLRVGMFRIGVLIANGHLTAAEDSCGRAGVQKGSVDREREWRSSASITGLAGRLLRDAFRYF